ncbi:MAG: dihydrodipicolinate reductase C-terminal domain-containing protein, partial [Saprospiraceae bacterium]|nr:dihydrodipicolinate reductase C-terminal domain-containing protein [Saprospiraceae bacterium]
MQIAIIGYGKMGRIIEQLAIKKGHEIVLKITSSNLPDFTIKNLSQADVAIEFSGPKSAYANIKKCLIAGVPVVSGTTAWLDKLEEAKYICKENNGAFLYASNFSIGVNIFFAINKQLAKMMNAHPEYNVTMEEIHHTQKLDAPSGTGITLAEGIIENLERKTNWVNEAEKAIEDLSLISKRI